MKKLFLCSLLFLFAFAANSYAIPIVGDTANSTESLGDFKGSFEFTATDDINATITVMLENTSPSDNGGYLVAFAFNNPDNLITSAMLATSASSNFNLIGDTTFDNTIDADPFGDFDVGGASTDSWLGGGAPTGGIGVGETETFTFALVGTSLSSLTTQDFVIELSEEGTFSYWFAARFRGFDDDGSDKVPGTPAPVPEPATILLLGSGLVGLAGFGRKKFKK